MSNSKAEKNKAMLKEAVQECLQPLAEKLERRLRILEKIIDEKADQEEEARPVEPETDLSPKDIFRLEVHFGWQVSQYILDSFVVSPLAIILGLFPFYNKSNAETRLSIRKYLLHNVNQSEISVTNRGNELKFKSTPSITIYSYFAQRHRNNNLTFNHFYTSPTSKRNQEFITWAPEKHYYHNCNHAQLQMVKIQMEGDNDGYLHVFLPKRHYTQVEFMSRLNSPNISLSAGRALPERITLPLFSVSTTCDINHFLENMGIVEHSFLHESQFQLNQSGVNVPVVSLEETLSESINCPENGETIEFLANRPFFFMLTKSNHVMYMGWYQ